MDPKTPRHFLSVSGQKGGQWYLDLKNGGGAVGKATDASPSPDVTFTLNDKDFLDVFEGRLSATSAFMSGKMKLKGDMGKALALDSIMKGMHQKRGFHTSTLRRADDGGPVYNSVPEVFDRIRAVANADIVKDVNATYCFDVEGEDKYFVDLKNGDGSVTKGEPESVADCTIKMTSGNIIKMFNRELKPATAFMTGQLKLSGDLAKAMKLEKVMVASREAMQKRSFHTSARRAFSAADAPPALYSSVPEVFERIKNVSNEDIVQKVQAIYLFDVKGKKYT